MEKTDVTVILAGPQIHIRLQGARAGFGTGEWLWQIKAIHTNASLIRRGQVTLERITGVSEEGSMHSKEGEIPSNWSSSAPI